MIASTVSPNGKPLPILPACVSALACRETKMPRNTRVEAVFLFLGTMFLVCSVSGAPGFLLLLLELFK